MYVYGYSYFTNYITISNTWISVLKLCQSKEQIMPRVICYFPAVKKYIFGDLFHIPMSVNTAAYEVLVVISIIITADNDHRLRPQWSCVLSGPMLGACQQEVTAWHLRERVTRCGPGPPSGRELLWPLGRCRTRSPYSCTNPPRNPPSPHLTHETTDIQNYKSKSALKNCQFKLPRHLRLF